MARARQDRRRRHRRRPWPSRSRTRSSTSPFGADLTNFVRQGNTRGLFESRAVVSVLTGEPEYLDPLGDETPEGWLVTGYPVGQLDTPEHTAFDAAYQAKFNELPAMGSVVGYALVNVDRRRHLQDRRHRHRARWRGFRRRRFDTPFGPASFRALDHQSTLGTFVGKLALKDGQGAMADWHYVDGADALPSDAEVEAAARCRPERSAGTERWTFLVQLLTGLAGASSLFLVAPGLTVIFGVTRVVNFAHGSL